MTDTQQPSVTARNPILFYTTGDGDPWAVFVMGHVDQSLVTLDVVNERLESQGFDPVEQIKVEHLHMWSKADDPDDSVSPEWPWLWCSEGDEGAVAITGVRFP